MKLVEELQDKTIIICENSYRENILKAITEQHLFLDIKFMSKKEFFQEYLFSYDEKTLSYLVEKYQMKVQVAQMYLDNLYYIVDKDYQSPKLNYLVTLKKELHNAGLLYYNKDFSQFLSNYHILVIGYSYLENYECDIFQKEGAKIIQEEAKYSLSEVYKFSYLEDEVNFVCKEIAKLLNKGININKIKLVGIDKDYYNTLERIFKFYQIPLKIPTNNYLIGNNIAKIFLDNLKYGYENAITKIKNYNSEIVNKIINICNKYNFLDNADIKKQLIINAFKNTKIDNFNLKNYVEIILLEDFIADDEYVFLLNFNAGVIPKTIKDESYITDNIKDEVNMNKVVTINKIMSNYTINKLKSIKNLIITYKLKDTKKEYYPSPLISTLNLQERVVNNNILESYSLIYDKINYAKLLYNYEKYHSTSEEYYILKNNLVIPYNTYDNKFKGINSESLKEFLGNKLTLSYSSLNNYNKCAFRFYLANILKIDKYEENFEAFIGSLFHDVLEKCFNENLIVKEEVTNYLKNSGKELTVKENFFVQKIVNDIEFVVNVLKKQKEYTKLDKCLYEKNIVIDKSRDIPVEFVGVVDKIMYKENINNTLVSIIDYKTGYIDIELKYVPYGLSLQLPIYLYLVQKSNLFPNPKFVGFYLQYILDKNISRGAKTYLEQKEDNLKLMGYSTNNQHYLAEFDKTYEQSLLIKSMSIKKDGNFGAYAKVLSDKEITNLINLTEKNIDNAITEILKGNFAINPKKIGFENDVGCAFCRFKDICFKKEEDYQILDEIMSLAFLGGEADAKVD